MWRVVLTGSLLCWGLSSSEITCKDKNGAAVDWYILYKVPKLNNRNLKGLEYFYIDSEKTEWHKDINDPEGVLANTLEPLLTPTQEIAFISYNDQLANTSVYSSFGHSKGVVMMDKSTGIWLLHSTPNFPRKENRFSFPKTGEKYAQTFMCATFAYSQFYQIGKHLQYIRAFPYDSAIPPGYHSTLQSVVKKEDLKPNNLLLVQKLESWGGQKFKSFAKYSSKSKKGKDLYFLIADNLKANLSAQTWQRSKYDNSACRKDGVAVYTIKSVKTAMGSWAKGNDHSKWCVTADQNKQWTCIADLNRQRSQKRRPGGALCIRRKNVRRAFRSFIERESCPPNRKRKIDQPYQSTST